MDPKNAPISLQPCRTPGRPLKRKQSCGCPLKRKQSCASKNDIGTQTEVKKQCTSTDIIGKNSMNVFSLQPSRTPGRPLKRKQSCESKKEVCTQTEGCESKKNACTQTEVKKQEAEEKSLMKILPGYRRL